MKKIHLRLPESEMSADDFDFEGIELLPAAGPVKQLIILLHGAGGAALDLMPLADALQTAFPEAALLLPDALFLFSADDATAAGFPEPAAADAPGPGNGSAAALHTLVRRAQAQFKRVQPDTALVGYAEGATAALHYALAHDGSVGRVLAFSGRFAALPERAPEFTTFHLLHGKDDAVVPVAHAYAAFDALSRQQGDATLDVASSVGHELHPALIERAVYRLQTCIPLRTWKQALVSA